MLDHLAIAVWDLARSKAFYAAFMFDPDGYNVEAVCHTGTEARADAAGCIAAS